MSCISLKTALVWLAFATSLATAHPGHGGLSQEIAERVAYLKHNPRNLNHCADKLQRRGVHARSLARRVAVVEDLQDKVKMKKRSIVARQAASASASSTLTPASASGMPMGSASGGFGPAPSGGMNGGRTQQNLSEFGHSVISTSHLSTLNVTNNSTDVTSIIFGNNSCILNPEGEIGPYYIQGEYVRSDISEDQAGVPLYLDQQYININTCEPIENLYADIWHCNATGVYGGLVANGNGNSNDTSNLNATFLRGIQPTDSDGVVYWQTIFPGFYQGRTTHIHMVTHAGATELANGTIAGGNVTHIGQLMFDQDLTNEINENVYPYTTNQQSLTENDVDAVFISETLTNSDPVVNYVKLGDDYEDGLFAWITIGVDPGALYATSAAATLAADGGHQNANSGGPPA